MFGTEFTFFIVRVHCDLWCNDGFCLEKQDVFKGVTAKWFVSWVLGASETFFIPEVEEVV